MSKSFKPTRLYIKRHSKTGLLYFGKTEKEDIIGYLGSGRDWKPHIKEHGKEFVEHVWNSDWFYEKAEIRAFAYAFSEIFDIVKSPDWANGMKENGTSGGPLPKASNHFTNNPIWQGKKREPRTKEHVENLKLSTLKNNNGLWPTYSRDESHKQDMSAAVIKALKNKKWPTISCVHCGFKMSGPGGPANMKRWHGDNCRALQLLV